MARYRSTGPIHVNGDVRVLARMEAPKTPDGEPEMVRLRADRQPQACVLLLEGTEFEVEDDHVPGPAWEPMDDAAKQAVARHHTAARPNAWNTVDKLPSRLDLRDPMERIDNLERTVSSLTSNIDRLIAAIVAPQADPPKLTLKRG